VKRQLEVQGIEVLGDPLTYFPTTTFCWSAWLAELPNHPLSRQVASKNNHRALRCTCFSDSRISHYWSSLLLLFLLSSSSTSTCKGLIFQALRFSAWIVDLDRTLRAVCRQVNKVTLARHTLVHCSTCPNSWTCCAPIREFDRKAARAVVILIGSCSVQDHGDIVRCSAVLVQ
jgi:hypothetical protein